MKPEEDIKLPVPDKFAAGLRAPVIVSPMFLTSGPDLVSACCGKGLIGTFPALNQRTVEGFSDWLTMIEERRAAVGRAAVYGVNLIVHKTNPRLAADLEVVVKHKVPLVITSLGAVPDVVDAVHSYGGIIMHDVIRTRHAEKAVEAGVDGIVAVAAGAGGHAGLMSPFALVGEIRSFFDGIVALAGAISNGRDVAAARMMGADFAYMGTRFMATEEAMVSDAQKQMMVSSSAADVLYTKNISGVHANFLRPSVVAAGLDPDNLPDHQELDMRNEARAWKNVWSAGQGVGAIHDVRPAAELAEALVAEYREAMRQAARDPFLEDAS
ncbi:NAD(P)H-dependent flavin oxidoreductase [Martelella mediterranea]|uniref:Nitronate monooxygenase n=1 Tax=Martelella mediterranea DSM 17316 TaxID=1122214 RepID=A0A1U9YWU0_9HYPH|nr:nitronate monooxygenase family protein [Martelella mediterranea]AQZ49894.1 Nitronate monooxygenase [Martelella mediterranea DSM 17316]